MHDLGFIAQRLLQFSPDALIVVDLSGKIQFANETTGAVFGYARDALIGLSVELLVPERFHIRHGVHVTGYLRTPTNREMGARLSDLFARRADGSEFPAGIRLAPFQVGDQQFIAAAIRDMTERREISDALVAARQEADRANRAKSRFLAMASHDLRQPLQTVRMLNASLQRLTENIPQLKALLEQQEAAMDGASRLLNALLDISRLESGIIEANLEPVALSSVFADLEQEFVSAAAAKGLTLDFVPSDLILRTDRILCTQLLQNLIGNAIKYTDRGFVRVRHSVSTEALTLCVEDSGAGIPDDKLDRIFDEYYQLGPHGTQRLGVGLGLAIVREVARLLDYSVSVFSAVDSGTQVHIRIPLETLVTNAAAAAKSAPRLAAVADKHTRVILLEDNDAVRKATELFLTLEGYETLSAGSVADAEPLLAKLAPGDILVADYHLDGTITGLDVLQQVRQRQRRDVPAVLLSGDLQSMMRVVRSPIPLARFLSKPVDTRALLQAIGELTAPTGMTP